MGRLFGKSGGAPLDDVKFNAAGFMALPVKKRIQHCRMMAKNALELSALATNKDHKAAYVEIANQWHSVADDMTGKATKTGQQGSKTT